MSFWGLVVEPNKLYSQTVPLAYRVTMAALGATDAKASCTRIVLVVDNKDEYVVCSLNPGKNEQQSLDLVLQAGAEIAFKVTGERPATVYLTGYYTEDDHAHCHSEDEEEDEECDSEMEGFLDDEAIEDEEEEDSEEAEFTDELSEEDFSDDDDLSEEDMTEEDEDCRIEEIDTESEEEESEEEQVPQKKRPAKEEASANNKKSKNVEKPAQPTPEDSKTESPKKQQQQKQQEEKKPQPAQPATPTTTGQLLKKTLPNGLQIEDITLGEGPKAKKGRKVGITYKGSLSNGKVFDESKGNDILRFTLGKGEVVKGMDLGVEGMSLGGVRRLTIPSNLGYGKTAVGKIPANSTLIFEVKLAQVNTQN